MIGRRLRFAATILVLASFVAAALFFWFRRVFTVPFEERVERAVVTTLQRESPEQFLVAGRLDIAASVHVSNTRVFLPDLLNLPIGTTEARVRVPGSVTYGLDLQEFGEHNIRVERDGRVVLTLPEIVVHAVEPHLGQIEIESRSGWFRPAESERRVTREALSHLREALQRQGEAHLRDSVQPQVNAARALTDLVLPIVEAAGVQNPQVEVRLGSGLRFDASD